MRGSGDEYQMPLLLLSETGDELVALVSSTAPFAAIGTGMRLVHDYQFGAGAQELVAPPLRLDEIGRDDGVGIALKKRLRGVAVALQPRGGTGQHQFGVEVKLLLQFCLPLFSELWRAEHGQARYLAAVDQFARDQRGLDGLANTYIIGDQQAHRVYPLQRYIDTGDLVLGATQRAQDQHLLA